MRRVKLGFALAVIGALMGLVAGCAGSDPDEARTPAGTPTITNGQPPADEGGGGGEGEGEGDAAAGEAFYAGACQGCHPAGGTQAGAGPVLAFRGLQADAIRNQIVNGGGAMPPGLATGADLDNVVAFVVGLQGEAAAGGGDGDSGGGDEAAVAAGKTAYESSCQGCHPAGGTQAGAGPVLAGVGLAEERIRTQITNGGGGMPPGLVQGEDLDNVTAFLLSLQ
jgi:mono/diheme cytochrome c family protein